MEASLAQQLPQGTVVLYWWISLVIGLVVIGVVALLLNVLTRTAEQIRTGAADIWGAGKHIANNTVHIPMLKQTNQFLDDILQSADTTAQATERIERAVVQR
jgi:hypothetical protein